MTDHLTDEERNTMLFEENAIAATHLAGCAACRLDLERLRAALADVRAESRALAERPQWFWREQRIGILARIPSRSAAQSRPLAWAFALAGLLLAASFLTQSVPSLQPQTSRASVPAAISAPVDPDHTLLMDVERSLRRDVPRALEPATLLAQELHDAAGRKSDR